MRLGLVVDQQRAGMAAVGVEASWAGAVARAEGVGAADETDTFHSYFMSSSAIRMHEMTTAAREMPRRAT
ncbi:MAG: hypothetical protein BGO49_26610 [Planctomycetales bacterium 71-10]|nr:MAG: hypothetical protein BGO49_26610 [Planctomycetales bacterium 71-10]